MNLKPKTDQLRAHDFRPGQSGNPGGRPKKLPITDYLKIQLEQPIPPAMLNAMRESARSAFLEVYGPSPTFGQMLAFKLVQMAAKGNMLAMNTLLDRTEGKVTQKVSGEDGGPIEFIVRRVGTSGNP